MSYTYFYNLVDLVKANKKDLQINTINDLLLMIYNDEYYKEEFGSMPIITKGDPDAVGTYFDELRTLGVKIIDYFYDYDWLISKGEIVKGKIVPGYFPDEFDGISRRDAKRLRNRVFNFIDGTCDYYVTMIRQYNKEASELIASIKTTSQVFSNDAPINLAMPEDFDNDKYWSTYVKSVATSDNGYLIDKLDNLRTKYFDVYSEWLNEFKKLLGGPPNYEDI